MDGVSVAELLAQLAEVGRDPNTGGYSRFSYTGADVEMRTWFVRQAHERGLRTETDRNGNLWATRGAGPYIAAGSHLDSVPNGGPFDGPLGIAAAFAALDRLDSDRDLAIIAFAEEEGSRFGVASLGSRLATGAVDADRARGLEDRNGVTLEEAMADVGLDPSTLGPDPERLSLIEMFVELHIEQGRGLIELGRAIGLGDSIWPHGRWRLEFHGISDHAGTTRMDDRHDALVAFANTVQQVTERARALGARATFGRLAIEPNATNAIPSLVTAWLDARAPTDEGLAALVDSIGSPATITKESFSPAIRFDANLRERIQALGEEQPVLATAAGHDAGVLAPLLPTAMIFVRNPSGVSHSPKEWASEEDCEAGVSFLARILKAL
jgi:N-carbamoyl-L-amino-acid hydrolase